MPTGPDLTSFGQGINKKLQIQILFYGVYKAKATAELILDKP